jgi:type IV pilus assembly protein PilQ
MGNVITINHKSRVTGKWLWALRAAVTLISLSWASAALTLTLDDIQFSSLPGSRVQIDVTLSEPLEGEPMVFTIDNPARIALDLPATSVAMKERMRPIGVGLAESVIAVEAEDRTRVVINLARLVSYDVSSTGNKVTFLLDSGLADLGGESVVDSALPGSAVGASITNLDFRRGESGQGRIVVDLSDPNVGINIAQQGEEIIVDFAGTSLPESFDRKLDVIDFATPVSEIDTFSKGNGTRMVITPTGLFEQLAYQSDNTFTLELRPLTQREGAELAKAKFGYTGERLSLNFQNIEVRAVLQLIADFTEKNLVASDTVGGSVTLRLKNVPWDQALDIILRSRGLGKREVGNVMMVAPQEELAAREKLELEAQQQIEELAPLRTEFVQVNYAKAGDIASMLKAEANNLLSERGNITVDERTNTLLVQDTGEKLSEIRSVVEALDIPVRQVLIESRLVNADENFAKDLGVRFGGATQYEWGSDGDKRYSSLAGGGIPGAPAVPTPGLAEGDLPYIVDLAAAGAAGGFQYTVGKVGSWFLQLELTALQAEGRGEIISAPRVITANQTEATIESGTEIPYQEAASSGATAVSFKKAVLSLKVTPQITPDDRIILDLSVNQDSVGQVYGGIPSIDTNELETQVLVDNGETVVLGGIFESSNRNDKTQVPFFGDLPYLGRLFKRTEQEIRKQELLVFVTPKILDESLTLNSR